MVKADNNKSLMLGVPGLILQAVGRVGFGDDLVGYALVLVGGALLIAGLAFYARGKGYPMALGVIGVLSCIGLIVLAVLPDKRKDG